MRRSAAIFFLLVIVLNGALELASVLAGAGLAAFASPRSREVEERDRSLCLDDAAWARAGKPALLDCPESEIACTCTCCGPVCSMGARCTCGEPRAPRAPAGGLFFALPGCSPSDLETASYMPASLGFVFLTPEAVPEPRLVASAAAPPVHTPRLPSGTLNPLTPPPEGAAVLSAA